LASLQLILSEYLVRRSVWPWRGGMFSRILEAWLPSKSKEYRAIAAECTQEAEQERDPDLKRFYEELAGDWKTLADQAEHRSRRDNA
jgi:hypothetical protein